MMNSREVAERFDVGHGIVLRGINDALPHAPADWFRPASGQSFDMTDSGLALLVMGLKGPKATAYTLSLMREFDGMHGEMIRRGMVPPVNPIDALFDKLADKPEPP